MEYIIETNFEPNSSRKEYFTDPAISDVETKFAESVAGGDFSHDDSSWTPVKPGGSWCRTASMSTDSSDNDGEESELSGTDPEDEYSDSDSKDEDSEINSDDYEVKEEKHVDICDKAKAKTEEASEDFKRSSHHHPFDRPPSRSFKRAKSNNGLDFGGSTSLADTSYQCNSFHASRVIMSQTSLNKCQEDTLNEAENNVNTYKNVSKQSAEVETKKQNEELNVPSVLASKCNPNVTSTYIGVNFGEKNGSERTSFLNHIELSRPNPSSRKFAGTSVGRKAEPKKSSLMELMEQFQLERSLFRAVYHS